MRRLLVSLLAVCAVALPGGAFALTGNEVLAAIKYAGTGGGYEYWQRVLMRSAFTVQMEGDTAGSVITVTVDTNFLHRIILDYEDLVYNPLLGCTWQEASLLGCSPTGTDGFMFWVPTAIASGAAGLTRYNTGCGTGTPGNWDVQRSGNLPAGASTSLSCLAQGTAKAEALLGFTTNFLGSPQLSAWRTADPVPSYALPKRADWNNWVRSAMRESLDKVKPGIFALQTLYGVQFSEVVEDEGYGSGVPGEPGSGGTGGTGGTSCGAGQSLVDGVCVDRTDSELNCWVLDIPCNLRKLFIPDKDWLKERLGNASVVNVAGVNTLAANKWEFTLHMPEFTGWGDWPLVIDFNAFVLPPAFLSTIGFLSWWAAFFYLLSFMGLPVLGTMAGAAMKDSINQEAAANRMYGAAVEEDKRRTLARRRGRRGP